MTLRSVTITEPQSNQPLDIVRPVFKLKHPQRFQTRIIEAFEKILKLFNA